jgi:general secretion pathway protein H
MVKQKLETGMRNKTGFTLIELLIVLVIIGITLSFALISFGDFGAKRRVISEAELFMSQIKLVQHQAMIESTPFSVRIGVKRYDVFRFKPPSDWVPVNPQQTLYHHVFPKNQVVHFDGESSAILIEASGDMTPFQLSFGLTTQSDITRVIGLANGALSLDAINSP